MEKAKYGKLRQVNAVNGSQMVVKLRGSYYRRVKGKKGDYNNCLHISIPAPSLSLGRIWKPSFS